MSASRVDDAFVAAWEAALAAYSDNLDEHRASLYAVEADATDIAWELQAVGPFVPPADLPIMPEAVVPWARQLLEQTNGLVQLAADLAARSERAIAAGAQGRRHRLAPVDAVASTWDALL